MREQPIVKKIIRIIAILFGMFYFFTSGFGIFSTQSNLAFYILFVDVLCLLSYPASKKMKDNKILAAVDVLLVLGVSTTVLYWMFEFSTYAAKRAGLPTTLDLVMAGALIILSLEVTRRTMGNALLILGVIMLLQTLMGPYLPGIFAHKGISLRQLLTFTFFTDGIFGTVTSTFAVYVMPFMIFGAFLEHSGGGEFFIKMATALAGKVSGGPALVAVGGSAIFGSISGSPIANVVGTGNFTIPLMKRIGYSPEFAGAVEAAASTGGSFLPPVMGAGAFILATTTNTPYGTIAAMAFVPALLYYWSLVSMVYFKARKEGLRGMPAEELPNAWQTFKDGWYYIFVIVLIIVALIAGFSVPRTAFSGCVFLFLCSMFRKDTRFTLKKLLDTFADAAKSSLVVGATAGTLGVIMAGITLTGLGVKFSSIILALAQGNLFFTVLLVALIAMVIGMGLTITASYIILAILAAPSLVALGVPMVVAHLACFWLSMTSNLTPPVCIAAFTAAGIAGGKPMKTGLHSCVLGIFLYVMPFSMVYCPQLLVVGHDPLSVAEILISYIFATIALSAVVQGWIFRRIKLWERGIYAVSCVLLMTPEFISDAIGLAIFLLMSLWLYRQRESLDQTPSAA